MKKFLSMIVLASIVVACSEDPEIDANVSRKIDIFAKTELTRTQLGTDGLQLLWGPNETIGVFGDVTKNAEFNSSNTEAVETTTFSGEITENDNTLLAYYPYVEGATNLGAIPFTLATDQEQTGNVPALAVNDLKFGKLVDQGDNKYACTFQQCFSLVKLTVSLANCDMVSGYHLESLWLQSEDAVMTGDFYLNMSTGALTVGEATCDNVNLEFTDKPALTDEITGWVILNPNVDAESTINVLLTAVDANGENPITATAELKTLQALEAGCAYNIPLDAEFLKFQVITLSTSEINFEANGGVETVTVTSDYENIVATSDADWVTVDKTSDTEYTITASANESSATRTATVTFTAEDETCKSINITQSAAEVGDDDNTETANCYMISAAGDYSFNATVMGNGASGVIADAGFHTTDAVITGGASAELLWQDTAGFITSVSYDNGRVFYTAGGNVGNAVIAVKNSAGTILWSWHIWGTGDRAVQDEVITNRAGNQFTVMDRTLGQLHKLTIADITAEDGSIFTDISSTANSASKKAAIELTLGDIYPTSNQAVLFQWGRKDPIPSATTYYDINNNSTDITTYPVTKPTDKSEATIAYSIQNPQYFIDLYSLEGNGVWLTEASNSEALWGDSYVVDALYTDDDAAIGWTYEKTIYDPCPAGYRVANRFMQTGFMVQKSDNNATSFPTNGIDDDALTDITQYMNVVVTTWLQGTVTRYAPAYSRGYFFMKNSEDNNVGTYFPQVPYRQGGGGFSSAITNSYYWTSSPSTTYYNGQSWLFSAFVRTNSAMGGKLDVAETFQKRCALPVRCVKY